MGNELAKISNSLLSEHNSLNINDLSDDLLMEILVRLPQKSACRCKTVSKRWLLLISDIPYFFCRFIKRHLTLLQQQQDQQKQGSMAFLSKRYMVILYLPSIIRSSLQLATDFEKNLSLSFLGPDFNPQYEGATKDTYLESEVIGCSDGLLLCRKSPSENLYYVCNPVTKEWIHLPPPPTPRRSKEVLEGFICEPYFHIELETETVTVNNHHRFRVVLLICIVSGSEFKAEVFSSETSQWSTSLVSCPEGSKFFSFRPPFPTVAHGGKLYFMGPSGILVYDPFHSDRQCHVLRGPFSTWFPNGNFAVTSSHLGTSCGNLRLSKLAHANNPPIFFSVWELKEKDSCWHLLHKTYLPWLEMENFVISQLEELPLAFGHLNYWNMRVQAFHPYDGDVVYFQYRHCIFVFNLQANEVQIAESGIENLLIRILPIDFRWCRTPIPSPQ